MKYLIHIILLFLILAELEGQSISLYPKKGKKIKIDKNFSLGNGSIIIKDNNLISKVLPLKNLKKIKYSQKSYKPIGDIFWFVGQFILGSSLVPAVIGDPEMFYKYAEVGSVLSIGGFALNKIGKKIGHKVVRYNLKNLNYSNRELIVESIMADITSLSHNKKSGEYYYKPHGKKLKLPNPRWFFSFSARDNSKGIEAFIIKHKLREKKFIEFAVPKNK